MQPTLAAFLKRSANSASSSSTTIAASSTTVTTTTSRISNKRAAKTKGEEEPIVTEAEDTKTEKKVKLIVEDNVSGEAAVVEAKEKTEASKDSKTLFLASSSSVAIGATQILTWADAEIEKVSDDKWKSILRKEAQKSRPLFMFLEKLPESKILPPKNNVFEAFKLCSFDDVKVVILGQDPYHGPKQAHGLAFSVRREVQVPPSLKNIFKEASNDVGAKSGSHGNLEGWAKQGVLLLNALLTVEPGTPMAHKGRGWEKFTDNCIAALSKEKKNLVFMLWGKPAQEKGKIVDRSKHFVITSSHPSPLGASQTSEPFLGSKCFSRCNEYLKKSGLDEIKWDVL